MNKDRPAQYAAGERPEDEREDKVDPFLIAAQRARLPRGMREVGISGGAPPPESGEESNRFTFRLYFEVNATLLGSLLETPPDTWLDEYLLFGRMRASGVCATITEYREFFPSGQVEEPSGDFDDVSQGDDLIAEIMRPICQVGE